MPDQNIDNSQSADKSQLPDMNGRKTLLIGLGSTGTMIANQMLERMTWSYGSPDKVPWLKIVTLETAVVPSDKYVYDYSEHHHITIGQQDYATLISNPKTFSQTLDFSRWDIPDCTKSSDSIVNGANNTRILGRLAFLFPQNFNAIMQLVSSRLQQLETLTNDVAQDVFNLDNPSPVKLKLSDNVHAYVIGTLCGGTASGSFIDMAYAIKRLPGYSGLPLTGIFTAPSEKEQNKLLIGNAVAALVELNHFSSDDSWYTAQFPDNAGVPYKTTAGGESPYKNFYVVQPRGAAKADLCLLYSTIADYVYSDIIGSNGGVRDASRTNIAQYFNTKDQYGATQKYFTFGMSIIEFPAAKVMKACTLRLAAKGLSDLLGPEGLAENDVMLNALQMPLANPNTLIDRLCQSTPENLQKRIDMVITEAESNANRTDEAMDLLKSQMKAAFTGDGSAHQQLPVRVVPQVIELNAKAAEQELMTSLRETIKGFITGDNPKGIRPLKPFLDYLDSTFRPDTGSPQTSLADLESELDDSMLHVTECRHDFWLGLTGGKSAAVSRYVDEFGAAARELYFRMLKSACAAPSAEIYAAARALVLRLKNRLFNEAPPEQGLPGSRVAGVDVSFLTEVLALTTAMQQLDAKTNVPYGTAPDGWSRVINGHELFNETTVDQEYAACISEKGLSRQLQGNAAAYEKILAREAVNPYIAESITSLLADVNQPCRFDSVTARSVTAITDGRLLKIAKPGQKVFDSVRNRSVVDRLLEWTDGQKLIDSLAESGRIFLDWNANSPRYVDMMQKKYGMVFYNADHPKSAEFRAMIERARLLSDATLQNVLEPHQLIVLHERGAFSLGTVRTLEANSTWWTNYEHPTTGQTKHLHSRGDIAAWISWMRQEEEERAGARSRFLVGIALDDGDIIKFVSANQYVMEWTRSGPAETPRLELTNDVEESARRLLSSGKLEVLDAKLDAYRASKSALTIADKVYKFIEGSNGLFTRSGAVLDAQQVQNLISDYVLSTPDLLEAYNKLINPVETRHFHKPDNDPAGELAFYCPNPDCKKKLGYTADCLYIIDESSGVPVRKRQCAYCGKAII